LLSWTNGLLPVRRAPAGSARGELGERVQVLCGGGEEEGVFCAVRTSEAQAVELQDAFQMCEQDLDLLPVTP